MALSLTASATPDKGKRKVTVRQEQTAPSLSYSDSLRYTYFFLRSFYYESMEQYDAGFDMLEHCRSINPNAPELYYFRAMYLSMLNKDSLALASIERAVELDPDNDTYLERVAQYYATTGQMDKAIRSFEQLAANTQDREDVLEVLLQLYQATKNYDKQLNVLQRMETANGPSLNTTLSKMKVYEDRGNKKKAKQVLMDLCNEYPNDPSYQVMLANWLVNNKEDEEAHKILSKILKEEPDNSAALLSMLDYYRNTGDTAKAVALRDKIILNKQTPADTKVSMLRQAIMDAEKAGGDSTDVIRLYDKVLAVEPNADIALMKAVYLQLKNASYRDINAELLYVLKLKPDTKGARESLILNYLREAAESSDLQDSLYVLAAEQAEMGVEISPEETDFYYFLGLSKSFLNEKEAAINALSTGVKTANDKSNHEMVSDMFGLMGDIYYELQKPTEAFAAYDSSLQWNAENASILNNYAYYLSERGEQLDKAEKMAARAVKKEPDEANYLDTYAWIFYKEGKYEQAKNYIDMCLNMPSADTDTTASQMVTDTAAVDTAMADTAAEELAHDGTFYKHAGDIYIQLGMTEEAVSFWKQALEREPDDEALKKKIQQYSK